MTRFNPTESDKDKKPPGIDRPRNKISPQGLAALLNWSPLNGFRVAAPSQPQPSPNWSAQPNNPCNWSQPRNFSTQPRNFSPPPRNFSPPPRNFSPPPRSFSPPPRNFSPPPRSWSPPRSQFKLYPQPNRTWSPSHSHSPSPPPPPPDMNQARTSTGSRNGSPATATVTSAAAATPTGSKDPPTLGITGPISKEEPKPIDLQLTKDLEEAMIPHNVFESDEEMGHRMEILSKLNVLVKDWVRDVSIKKNMPVAVADKMGGKIYTFGSYRLGVHSRGADIDALCVAPRHVDRSDYFTSFVEVLKEQPEVTDLRVVENAFVPVLKLTFDGIDIDMVFSRLALREIPDDLDLADDSLLKNLDQKCVRSLNGCRVTDAILGSVPNIATFRLALRAIKLWAKDRKIYSNVLGYFGGVSWAMLVARVCQLYPNAAASSIVERFFNIYAKWDWPLPVLLKRPTPPANTSLHFPVWDPVINPQDRSHLMPIITPAYPQQNSTFNTSYSNKKIIMNEIIRGREITDEIALGKAGWSKLFEVPNLFNTYKHFIALIASSSSAEDQLEWYGLVESRIRILIGHLEKDPHIELPHIIPHSFPPLNPEPGRYCNQWFIGLIFSKEANNLSVDLTGAIQGFTNHVLAHAEHVMVLKEGMELDARYVRKRHLTQYLPENVLGVGFNKSSSSDKKRKRPSVSESEATPNKVEKKTEDDASPGTSENSRKRALNNDEGGAPIPNKMRRKSDEDSSGSTSSDNKLKRALDQAEMSGAGEDGPVDGKRRRSDGYSSSPNGNVEPSLEDAQAIPPVDGQKMNIPLVNNDGLLDKSEEIDSLYTTNNDQDDDKNVA